MDFDGAMGSFASSMSRGISNGASIGASNGATIFNDMDLSLERVPKKTSSIAFDFMDRFFLAFQGMANSMSLANIASSITPPPILGSSKMPSVISFGRGK